MDDERLKNVGGGVYWKELLARIRDIRASEKSFIKKLGKNWKIEYRMGEI